MLVNSNLVKNSVMLGDDDLGDIFGMLTLYAIQSKSLLRSRAEGDYEQLKMYFLRNNYRI